MHTSSHNVGHHQHPSQRSESWNRVLNDCQSSRFFHYHVCLNDYLTMSHALPSWFGDTNRTFLLRYERLVVQCCWFRTMLHRVLSDCWCQSLPLHSMSWLHCQLLELSNCSAILHCDCAKLPAKENRRRQVLKILFQLSTAITIFSYSSFYRCRALLTKSFMILSLPRRRERVFKTLNFRVPPAPHCHWQWTPCRGDKVFFENFV